ncbi:hypothetical protein [Psychromicrobium lacuslunae]|uniref:Uncharacterized protein n=1 Tax=Psychromicrobium lacuslunae TaxID=1618207 RepID=A0A0D4C1C5_9MICC|nr:hypothetical protein [Psychromicrobium lacuslunae]AJT42195.1 hypothetical protein UM93_13030 [Psychromicrobium lacuslunae]
MFTTLKRQYSVLGVAALAIPALLLGSSMAQANPAAPIVDRAAHSKAIVESKNPKFSIYRTNSGLFSFKLPKGYTVKEQANQWLSEQLGRQVVDIYIYSAKGLQIGYLAERYYADGASGPAPKQLILDQAATPNMHYSPGATINYYLSYNSYSGFGEVTMRLEDRNKGSYGVAPSQFEVTGNFISVFTVNVANILGDISSPQQVKAWQHTAQYAALKTMLSSLTVN